MSGVGCVPVSGSVWVIIKTLGKELCVPSHDIPLAELLTGISLRLINMIFTPGCRLLSSSCFISNSVKKPDPDPEGSMREQRIVLESRESESRETFYWFLIMRRKEMKYLVCNQTLMDWRVRTFPHPCSIIYHL